jgi:hypothetical protein
VSSTRGAERARRHVSVFAITGLLTAAALLITASVALAGADPLKGGDTVLNLKLKKKLKVKVKSPAEGASISGKTTVTLPITGGSFDPNFGSGPVENGGTFVLKRKKKKAKITEVRPTYGGLYAGGTLSAKVNGKVVTLADLTGGTVSRAGFGGKIDAAKANLTKAGAKALNKALGLKKKKKNGKKNKNRFKKGKLFADSTTTTIPKTVEVIGGTAITHGSTGFGKLVVGGAPGCPAFYPVAAPGNPANRPCYGKGVNPTPGQGITASGGASYPATGAAITAPVVTPSAIAPDASDGSVKTGGTINIKKTVSALIYGAAGAPCNTAMPVGNFIQFTNTTNEFLNKNVLVDLTIQSPALGFPAASPFGTQIPSGHIDMGSATVTADPATKKIDIVGFAVRNDNAAQTTLINGTFGRGADPPNGNGCGLAATDSAIGDALFTVDLHMITH